MKRRLVLLSLVTVCACDTSSAWVAEPLLDGGRVRAIPDAGSDPAGTPMQLSSYKEITTAMLVGQPVYSVYDYRHCQLYVGGQPPKPGPDSLGRDELTTFELHRPAPGKPRGFVESSGSKLVWISFNGARQHVESFGRTRLYDDGQVELVAGFLDPLTVVSKTQMLFCQLDTEGKGASAGGAAFFWQPTPFVRVVGFAALKRAIDGGGDIHAMIDYSKCDAIKDGAVTGKGPAVTLRMALGDTETLGTGRQAAIGASFTAMAPGPQGMERRSTTVRFLADDRVTVLVQHNDPQTLVEQARESYSCDMTTDPTKAAAVALYNRER